MTDGIKNMEASVRARLGNIARKEKINFDLVLLLFMQERFVLKGGLLILSSTNIKTRPTKDIDFLAKHISNDVEEIKNAFMKICMIEVNDGVNFDLESLTVERITEAADYQGVRIKVTSFIGNARKRLQLDIGFGDVIVPKAIEMDYPGLLDFKTPKINTYSLESVIAEKFEAMIRLSLLNSRMKDFYDIYILSNLKSYDGRVLYEAVFTTLQRRGTPVEKDQIIFKDIFAQDEERKKLWEVYLKKIGKKFFDFEDVMNRIKLFMLPIYEKILSESEFFGVWNNEKSQWDIYEGF